MELTLQRWDSDYAGFTAQKRGGLQGQEWEGRSGGGLGVSLGRRAKGTEAHGQKRVAQEKKAEVMHRTAEGQGPPAGRVQ